MRLVFSVFEQNPGVCVCVFSSSVRFFNWSRIHLRDRARGGPHALPCETKRENDLTHLQEMNQYGECSGALDRE